MKSEIYNPMVSYSLRRLITGGLLVGLLLWNGAQANVLRAGLGQGAADEPAVTAFNERVKQYIKLREKAEGQLPKLSTKSQPPEIEAHLVSLQTNIIAARAGAKPGDIFRPDIADHIRQLVRQEFKGARLKQLRERVREAETKGVPLRVNVLYPETRELLEMPPTLLLKLPALPKQLHYHFVGRALVLLDKEARLIVDYLPGALP